MNKHERAKMVRAMETVMRGLNDEDIFEGWLVAGVADGDIDGTETDEDLEYYCEDKVFQDLMATFCRIMHLATCDGQKNGRFDATGILYVDGLISKKEE